MAPTSTVQLGVRGRTKMSGEKVLLVLDEQLRGHDTFLTAILHLDQPVRADGLQVRILTFDDVTVLSPLQSTALPEEGEKEWSGTLLLPHGLRPPRIPNDLAAAVAEAGIDPDAWSGPEARQLLAFLGEAGTGPLRAERISLIVQSLGRRT
ncbi:hypothetical protein ACWGI1_00620 [Streptomyces sp. NPDC054835]